MEHLIAVIVGGALMFLGFVIGSIIVLVALIKLAKVNGEKPNESLKPLAKMFMNSQYGKPDWAETLPAYAQADIEATQRIFDVNSMHPNVVTDSSVVSQEAFSKEYEQVIVGQEKIIEKSKDIFDKIQEILVRDPSIDPSEEELEEISDLVRDGWSAVRGHDIEETPVHA